MKVKYLHLWSDKICSGWEKAASRISEGNQTQNQMQGVSRRIQEQTGEELQNFLWIVVFQSFEGLAGAWEVVWSLLQVQLPPLWEKFQSKDPGIGRQYLFKFQAFQKHPKLISLRFFSHPDEETWGTTAFIRNALSVQVYHLTPAALFFPLMKI